MFTALTFKLSSHYLHVHQQQTTAKATAAGEDGTERHQTQFPQKLKDYVARCFEYISDESKADVERALKVIITRAFEAKTVWTIDWDNMELPHPHMKRQGKTKSHIDGDIVMKETGDRVQGGLRNVETNQANGISTMQSSVSTPSPNSSDFTRSKKRKRFVFGPQLNYQARLNFAQVIKLIMSLSLALTPASLLTRTP